MKISRILAGIGVATFISFASFLTILFEVDPTRTSGSIRALFFISLALFLTGVLTLSLYPAKKKFLRKKEQPRLITDSFRQSLLVAIWLVGFFVLGVVGVSKLVAFLLPGLVLGFIEYYFFHR